LIPVLLQERGRRNWRLALQTALLFTVLTGVVYAATLAGLGIYTVSGVRAWIADSAHGVASVSGVGRMAFGLPRSFVYLGRDGMFVKRYLLKDPYNPVSLADLVWRSLWIIALFYLFLAALICNLARTPRTRRYLTLLAVAALPTLGFAAAWQGGDLERYLPLYPFLFLALAAAVEERTWISPSGLLALAFFGVAAWANLRVMAAPVRESQRQELVRRVEELQKMRSENSIVLVVRDELIGLHRNHPLHRMARPLDPETAVSPGLSGSDRWRQQLAGRLLEMWERGGEVWISERVFRPAPRVDSNWTEGEDRNIAWAAVYGAFSQLETGTTVGGDDGFRLIVDSAKNRRIVAAWRPE
jgi:hypothetical protein